MGLLCACGPAPRDPGGAPAPEPTDPVQTFAPTSPSPDTGTPPEIEPSDGAWDGCRAFDDCPDDLVCLASLGRCEARVDWIAASAELLDFHPPAGTAGDLLVIDGARLSSRPLFPGAIDVEIGGTPAVVERLGGPDDTRLTVRVPTGAEGPITVTNEDGETVVSADSFAQTAAGLLPCDGATPTARGTPGASPVDAGPYAAGWLDLPAHTTRVFYPARCGSVRRPPEPGTWPLVALLHGNGAGFVNYEYLGQHLATWGFVSVMPFSENEDVPITLEQTTDLLDRLALVRGRELSGVDGVLTGVTTTAEVAFVGHSRGTARIQHVVAADPDVWDHTVAAVFLGAVDDGMDTPGGLMVFHGTEDRQSLEVAVDATWNRHPGPKWSIRILGGNHSLFSDHKVWTGFLDGEPTIPRRDQHATVARYTLPLMQRAFGLDEPFAAELDAPDPEPFVEVERAP